MTSEPAVRKVLRRAVGITAGTVAAVATAAAGWMLYANHAGAAAEVQSPRDIAAGRGHWTEATDSTLYSQGWGPENGPLVVLTHGTGAWSGTWFELPERLAAAGWRVVAVDLPPFGLSSPHTALGFDYSRAAQARRIRALLRELGRPAVLVGHSFGAGPALEAAVTGGSLVRGLVLVDPALGLGQGGEAPTCEDNGSGRLLAHRPLRTALVRATATTEAFTGTLLKQFVHRKEVVTERLLPAYRVPFQKQGYSATLGDWAVQFGSGACEDAVSLRPESLQAWSSKGARVDFIWGAEDTVTPLAQGRVLQRWLRGSSLTVLPGLGHIPHIEAPAEFGLELVRLLAGYR